MKLTKYEHSCVVLEKDGKSLVIDPGIFSPSFEVPQNVVGVVVSHEHPDHFDIEKLQLVSGSNPDAVIYTNPSVASLIGGDLKARVVSKQPGEGEVVGNFQLQFVGGQHAVIRLNIPICENLGVIVDGCYYHPGDSYFEPSERYAWLGIPLSAPWAKISETVDFINSSKAKKAFQIHDALLSEAGRMVYDRQIQAVCNDADVELCFLKPGEQIELDNEN